MSTGPTPQSATATSAGPSATPSGAVYGGTYWGTGDGSFSSSWVTWVSVVVVAGVVVALLCSRFFYIRRFYVPSFRSYFIPHKGIHVPRLGLHIAGPILRIPREPPPSYEAAARRRRRRGRQTAGETVGEGGRRIGARDADDGWDDLDLAERASVAPDDLPHYYADSGLPGYFGAEGDAADEAERIRNEAAVAGESSVIPSAAEYEAASRPARGLEAQGQPAYPPAAHLSPPVPNPLAPTMPRPPNMRSSTARSSILLSAFRRAPSPVPAHNAVAPADEERHVPAASSSSSFQTAASDEPRPHPRRQRSASSASTSSSATKLEASSESASVKGKQADDDSAGASSSRVKLDDASVEVDAEKPPARKDGGA